MDTATLYISLFILVTYKVQCPAKIGLQVTLNTILYLRVLVTVRPDRHRAQCWPTVYDADPPLNQPRPHSSPTDGMNSSVLHNHPH